MDQDRTHAPARETEKLSEGKSDWQRLRSMTDADIARAVASDPDAAPILTPEQLRQEYRPVPARARR
jgi:hypothetical protein